MKKMTICLLALSLVAFFALRGHSYAQIKLDPVGFAEALDEGDTLVETLILTNDDVDNAVPYAIAYEGVDREEMMRDGQGENNPVQGRRRGPRRDQPESRYLLIHESNGWGYNLEQIFTGIQDLNYDRIRTPAGLDDIDLNDYNCLWLGNFESENWVAQYNERRDQIAEWVDAGHTMYFSSGTNNHNTRPINPGGLRYHWGEQNGDQSQNECPLAVGPEDNWFINYMDENDPFDFRWEEGARLHGNGHAHGVFYQDEIDEIENSDWQQVLVMGNPVQQPVTLVYSFGRGFCFVSTSVDGFLHANPRDYHWGRTGPGVIWYLDYLTSPAWVIIDPEEGEIPAGEEIELEVMFISTDMEDGTYELLIQILSGEDEDVAAEMTALLTVGEPTAAITGVITDAATGDPIEGATASTDVYIYERPADADGIYALVNLPTASYTITFSARDYLPTSEEVDLGEDGVELNVALLHAESVLSEERIDMELAPDTDTHIDFSLANDGNGPLTYSVERRLIGDANAAPWELRRQYNIAQILEDDRIEGVAFDGENFYYAGANRDDPNTIYITDREGQPVGSFDQPGQSRYGMKDLEFDGELLWGSGDEERRIFGFDTEGNVAHNFVGPWNPTSSVAYDSDREALWLCGTTTNIAGYTREGEATGVVLNRKALRIYGLAYWPDDPDGYPLYILNSAGAGLMAVHKMNPANGDTLRVRNLAPVEGATPGGAFICNTFDVYSWVMMMTNNVPPNAGSDKSFIYQLDARKEWFLVDPTAGVVQAGEAQEFDLHLDATGLPAVTFEGELLFTHDGVGGATILPIRLDVVEGPVHSRRTLELGLGWNLVSVNLQPDEDDMVVLTQGLVDAGLLLMVKDDEGHFYTPGNGFSNLAGWDVAEGYWMKLNRAAELELAGVTVMSDDRLALHEGWQSVSYYPRRAVEASVALSGIENVLRVAKDGLGNFYLPSFDFSNLGDLREGRGYQLKVTEAAELVYRTRREGLASRAHSFTSVYDRPGRYPLHPPTGGNMSLLIMTPPPTPPASGGEEGGVRDVGVYAGEILVGCGVIQSSMAGVAVWGDDPSTAAIDGAVEGDVLTLRLRDDSGEREASARLLQGELTYRTDGLAVVEFEAVVLPAEFGLTSVYPNPFNSVMSIEFALQRAGAAKVALYDLSGREVMNLMEGNFSAGGHRIALNGDNLSSGIYVMRVESLGRVSQMKVALVK